MEFDKTITMNTSSNNNNADDELVLNQVSQQLSDINAQYCDHLTEELQHVFAAIVPDFPRLEQPQALLERLERSYMRHVDVIEVYAARNIFTLDNLPSNRQVVIAKLWLEYQQQEKKNNMNSIALELRQDEQSNSMSENNTMDYSAAVDFDVSALKSTPPISKQQVDAKRAAVLALQEKIAAARTRQALLQRRLTELDVATQASSSWPINADQAVHESVSALMMGVHGMEDCHEQGVAAVELAKKRRMNNDSNKNSNYDEEDDDDKLTWELHSSNQTVEELYAQERKRVHATTEDLQHLHRMLVGNRA